jgi:hypothetical protein
MVMSLIRDEDGRIMWRVCKKPPSLHRRAVERRVQHRLYPKGLVLRKCSPRSRWYAQLGDYYLVTINTRTVLTTHQHLDDLAREHRVIREGQAIADE